uniref:Uncharacterized protein n=1 Tax=Lactuca sativa TaxID=4236 RepID=A0A9R1XCU6_LACSA|nr:hypothetical protein LSAT_V11C500286300 [Lactuca sativa]
MCSDHLFHIRDHDTCIRCGMMGTHLDLKRSTIISLGSCTIAATSLNFMEFPYNRWSKTRSQISRIGEHNQCNFEDEHVVTGFGNHLPYPILPEEWRGDLTFEEGVKTCFRKNEYINVELDTAFTTNIVVQGKPIF